MTKRQRYQLYKRLRTNIPFHEFKQILKKYIKTSYERHWYYSEYGIYIGLK